MKERKKRKKERKEKKIRHQYVKQERIHGHNILYCLASRPEIDFHETVFELLLKTFENREELKDLILKNSISSNFIHNLVMSNKNLAIIELAFNFFKEKLTMTKLSRLNNPEMVEDGSLTSCATKVKPSSMLTMY